jgi:phosphoenolpyruvate carboxylase
MLEAPITKNNTAQLKAFNELVKMKYQIYNGLFLDLPFAEIENRGAQLSLLSSKCLAALEKKETPFQIIKSFLTEIAPNQDYQSHIKILFQILQFVERQVVLFDALEDAAFDKVHDMMGQGTLEHLISRISTSNKDKLLAQIINEYKVRIVLTAHPTQFYPRSILGIITDLSLAIRDNKLLEIDSLLLQMGRTPFKNKFKPTPFDEAKSLIWYLENIFYDTLPQIQLRLKEFFNDTNPKELNACAELGFWPGGDRDGNPFVTSEITREVARTLKSSIVSLYIKDLQLLKRRLTFDGVYEDLIAIEEKLLGNSHNEVFNIDITHNTPVSSYKDASELLADLYSLRNKLQQNHQSLFLDKLDYFILKVQIFGFYFASLDLRQDSSIHQQVISEILKKANYSDLSEVEKTKHLKQIITSKNFNSEDNLLDISKDTIDSLRLAQEIHKQNGELGMHRYIISNTQSVSNVLEIIALASVAGWSTESLKMDIVPLFETINDLTNAKEIMDQLYKDPLYKAHLLQRKNVQTIMLGFSDGTKDGGYVAANWAIYKAKKSLTEISRQYGIKVVFFDGRGGPPARGGGNTHKFYRSLGNNIEHDQIQLTIQGQTISSNYGTEQSARFNLEQLFTAGLEQKIFPEEILELNEKDFALLEDLAKSSLKAYKDLKNHNLFLPYLEEVTPLNFYNNLNIASRPSKRKSNSSLKFDDLRAIPFVGAWTQMKQNIPGFYGLGSALNTLIKEKRLDEIKDLYKKSLFFRTLLENAMQSLSKSYFPLTYYLAEDKKFGEFWKIIYKEANLTKELLKEVSGQNELLETVGAGKESINLREKIVLPLLTIQHFAMMELRKAKEDPIKYSPEELEALNKIVIKSLAANVNASRNSV